MLGKTLVRWLAGSGGPETTAGAEVNESDDQPRENRHPTYVGDNWLIRRIQRNRVLTASGIAVGLFAFGGFAWSARNETRLVRKVTSENAANENDTMFDELLDLPNYPATDKLQLSNAPDPIVSGADNDSSSYDPFEQLPALGSETTSSFSDSDRLSPQITMPRTIDSPPLGTPDAPTVTFPTLGLPELDHEPQLDDLADQAEPLLNSNNPFLSE